MNSCARRASFLATRPPSNEEKARTSTSAAAAGIVAEDVCKSYGDHVVLDKVSLTVEQGTIFALLGPNGAGKTTLVRILSTLIPADSGSMRVAGHDVASDPDGVRAVVGVTGQFSAVDNLLTGAENLQMMAAFAISAANPGNCGSRSCWSNSTSPPPRTSCFRPTRAGCGDASISR